MASSATVWRDGVVSVAFPGRLPKPACKSMLLGLLGLGSHLRHMLRRFDPRVQPEEGRKKHVLNAAAACLQQGFGNLSCVGAAGSESIPSAYWQRGHSPPKRSPECDQKPGTRQLPVLWLPFLVPEVFNRLMWWTAYFGRECCLRTSEPLGGGLL